MSQSVPLTDYFCPVCGQDRKFLMLWQEPGTDRIRIFCDECFRRDEYRALPKEERTVLSAEGFGRFATRRLLTHVLERERAKLAP